MATQVKRARPAEAQRPAIEIPYVDTFNHVKKGYRHGTWFWVLVVSVVTALAIYYLNTQDFSPVVVIGLGLGLFGGAAIPIYFSRASDAMLSGQVNQKHLDRCIWCLQDKRYDNPSLKKIRRMAEADKDAIASRGTLTSVFLSIAVAVAAAAFRLPPDFEIPVLVIGAGLLFVSVTFFSVLAQAEQGNADLVIMQATTHLLLAED